MVCLSSRRVELVALGSGFRHQDRVILISTHGKLFHSFFSFFKQSPHLRVPKAARLRSDPLQSESIVRLQAV